MGFNRWLGAILLTSTLTLAGCNPPQPANTSAPSSGNTPTAVATTPAPVDTGTPIAATGTPTAPGTPIAAGSPAAGDDFANAEGMIGYEEVLVLAPTASTPADVEAGKALFAANCASCHGPDGKGDGDAGKALDPPPRNLHAQADYKYGASERGIYRTVFYGVEGTGMAPLEGVLTPDQIWQVVHYVRTLEGT